MNNYNSVLDMIGNTPMLKVNAMDTGLCELFIKIEYQNPGGSIKDRIGLAMIEDAESKGILKPGGTIIEATAGNTGLGLALVAAQKGYQLILIIPDKMSQDKIFHLKALGCEIILTRSDVGKGHPEYYQDIAQRLNNEIPDSFFVNQFSNHANSDIHFKTTGPEIYQQMDGNIDAFVAGVGSGGTVTGVGKYLKSVSPNTQIVVADPEGSVIAEAVKTGEVNYEGGSWLVEGIGEDFIPDILDLSVIDDAVTVSDKEAFQSIQDLLQHEGLLGGSSTGTLVAGAIKWCKQQTEPKRVVTFACDTGNKYLNKAFNQSWLVDNNLVHRTLQGNLADMVSRRADLDELVSVRPQDNINTAYNRMRTADISQLLVMEEAKLVGIIDEEDIMLGVYKDVQAFNNTVESIMVSNLETLDVNDSIDAVATLLNKDRVAIIKSSGQLIGLITKIDFVNYMRKQLT